MPTFAPVLSPLVLDFWDDMGEAVDPVLVVWDGPVLVVVLVVWDDPVLEELVVEDGAKTYPLSWTAKTLAPSAVMVVVVLTNGVGL